MPLLQQRFARLPAFEALLPQSCVRGDGGMSKLTTALFCVGRELLERAFFLAACTFPLRSEWDRRRNIERIDIFIVFKDRILDFIHGTNWQYAVGRWVGGPREERQSAQTLLYVNSQV